MLRIYRNGGTNDVNDTALVIALMFIFLTFGWIWYQFVGRLPREPMD